MPGLLAPQALALLRMARGMGYGQLDTTAMLKVYKLILGCEARL